MIQLSKQLNKYFIFIFHFSLLVITFSSCKTMEKVSVEKPKPEVKVVEKTADDLLIEEVNNLSPIFKTYSAKLDIKFNGNSFGGNIRMQKDSIIWISVSKFGLEGARLKLTKDSVFFINKLYSEAFSGDYGFFAKMIGFNLDYNTIQSFILATDLKDYNTSNFLINRGASTIIITYNNRESKLSSNNTSRINQTIYYNSSNKRIDRNVLQVVNNINKLDVNYSKYISLQSISLPTQYKFFVPSLTKAQIELKTEKHQINTPQEYPFSIPKSYERIK